LLDKYNIYKDYPTSITMKIACSTHAMRVCVCVKTLFPQGLIFTNMTRSNKIF
jgi:hypothetical protein